MSYSSIRNSPNKNSSFLKPGTEIIPGKLHLTSLVEAEDSSFLKDKKITAVLTINNEPARIPAEIEKSGDIKTLYINLGDNCTSQIKNYFEEINSFINENDCVLVHCYAGVSRSATAVLAYIMKHQNLSLTKALMFVKNKRHVICPNFSFMGQLKSYEMELHQIGVNNLEKGLPKLVFEKNGSSQESNDSGVDTSESSNESPLGSPKNKVQKIEYDCMKYGCSVKTRYDCMNDVQNNVRE